jgi:thymidylate synthase
VPDLVSHARLWPHYYVDLLDYVAARGRERSPRGQPTRELRDFVLAIDPNADGAVTGLLPTGVGRGLNLKIAALEALQLCCGIELPELSHRVAPALTPFAEDDGRFWGAYGARIGGQLIDCYHKLVADPDTRQAVVSLWDPALDGRGGKRDHPCTLSLTFSLIDGRLEVSVTMRSNDAWLGIPYDVWQFSALQASLANALGVPVGRYTHHAVSLHLYERDLPKLEQLHRHDGSYLEHNGGFRFSRLVEQEAFDHEHLKLFGLTLTSWPDITSMPGLENLPVERWYREQLVAP